MFDAMADWMTVPLLQQEAGAPPQRMALPHLDLAYGAFLSATASHPHFHPERPRMAGAGGESFGRHGARRRSAFATNVERVKRRTQTDGRVAACSPRTMPMRSSKNSPPPISRLRASTVRPSSPAIRSCAASPSTPERPVSYPAPAERNARRRGAMARAGAREHSEKVRAEFTTATMSVNNRGETSWKSASSVSAIWVRIWRAAWSRPATKSSSTIPDRKRSAISRAWRYGGALAKGSRRLGRDRVGQPADARHRAQSGDRTGRRDRRQARAPLRRSVDHRRGDGATHFQIARRADIVQIDARSPRRSRRREGNCRCHGVGPRADVEAVEPALKVIGKFSTSASDPARARR